MANDEHRQVQRDFREAVNMSPAELEKWLGTTDSQSVGWADGANKTGPGGTEATGHKEGRRIVDIRRKKVSELTDDYAHMKRVVGYVHRHLAQRSSGDTDHSRWRSSLKN